MKRHSGSQFKFVLVWLVALLPVLAKVQAQALECRWQAALAGHVQVGCRTGDADVQVFIEQRRVQSGELVNADKEHRLELHAFDVLDVEHAHVTFSSPSSSSTTTRAMAGSATST
ncbi:hypothetical protein i14_4894 [Escherichia coli str. 'clone D i14']|uniref:Uncharacterized protein n=1 Tax=Escherichia coli O6:H1 (strain CFT073 / ATCC 700928 / UPEC) TaxID=199310 RepID=A0A0H2VE57_ECOL6|nr:Hypothetical protein c5374 [Escherichia coli CFT073]ADN49318.1 hypothetical protein ECABU_c49410 [Escherichia coli ABU 83972]AER87410.1 hypothetical protein i02_4894 [Escherichia coli str. 'clone D i2']AER92329.1 hypothetical protein i14_4894 [Escherichia coli str. 'clone D i14']